MKKLRVTLCALLVLFSGLMFAACSGKEPNKDFNVEKFEIKNAEAVYDANSHIFEVEYEEVELNVTYSVDQVLYKPANQLNFVNAGTYDVYYKVSADGYNTFTSTNPVEMKINKRTATVTVGDTVIYKSDEVTTIDPEYTIDGLVGSDTISVSFGIGKNADTGADYDANLALAGSKYNYITTAQESANYNIVFDVQGKVLVKDYDFNPESLEIQDAEVIYDGNAHLFQVEYEEMDVDVTYSLDNETFKPADQFNFVNAGTYNVYYRVSAEGFNTYTSTEPVAMKINKRTATVTVEDTIICKTDAVTTIDPEYTIDGLVGSDTISVSFGIGKNADTGVNYDATAAQVNNKYNYTITSEESANYDIVFNTQGKVVVKDYFEIITGTNVQYTTTLQEAFTKLGEEDKSIIKLYKDILANGTALDDIVLKATDKNYDFTIDLNGHKLEAELDFVNWISGSEQNGNVNYTGYGIKVNIVDSSEEKTGVVGGPLSAYGVLVKGDEKISVAMSNIVAQGYWGGVYYNGNCADAKISAENCLFQGITIEDETNCGAYMAGDAVCTFVNCTFEGMTGYYAKSGSHVFNACTFIGNKEEYQAPKFNGNAAEETGSAFVVDLAKGYTQPLIVTINGGTFSSVAGYCIEQNTTTNGEPVDVHPDTRIVLTGSNSYLHYGEGKSAVSTTNSVIQGQ